MQLSRDTIQRMISGSGTSGGAAAGSGGGGVPYVLPLAADGVRGGVQIGYTQSGKNYPVQLDGEKMYVNVPWQDHHDWGDITNKPTTVSGYGITDMGSQSVNYANSAGAVDWANVTNKPSFNYLPLTGGEISGNLNVTGTLSMGSKTVATQEWVGNNYISISFFSRLFQAYNSTTPVNPNDTTTTIDNIKAMFGFWTEQYISALGRGTGGGGGGGGASALYECTDVDRDGNKVLGAATGKVLTYSSSGRWYAASIPAPAWGEITGKPTTVSGYGITDAITTANIGSQSVSYASTSGSATYATSAGSASTAASAGYATEAGAVAWANVSNKPSQLFYQRGDVGDNYVNGTTYQSLDSGTYKHAITGASESMIHFQHEGSASGLDIKFEYSQDSSHPLKYRKNIDNSSFASVSWVTIIDSLNIGSQSVNYAASAGYANSAGSAPASDVYAWAKAASKPSYNLDEVADGTTRKLSNYLPLAGGTMTGDLTMSNAKYIKVKDTSGNAYNLFGITESNYVIFGMGTAGAGYTSYIDGKEIYFRYGTSRTNGMMLSTAGTLTIYNTNDAQETVWNNPALCIGDQSGSHLEIDNNEIIAKANATTVSTLSLGGSGGVVRVRGKLGVGTNSPSYDLDVVGNIHASTGIVSDSYVTALSDERLKHVLGDVELSVEDIAKMPIVRFRWRDPRKRGTFVGTLAQAWQPLLPEAVHQQPNGNLSFEYQTAALVGLGMVSRRVVDHESRLCRLERMFAINDNDIEDN